LNALPVRPGRDLGLITFIPAAALKDSYLQFYWVYYFSNTSKLSHELDLIRWIPNRVEALMLCIDKVE
jgi:hypothetical protein